MTEITKKLYVRSGGRWVATAGSGTGVTPIIEHDTAIPAPGPTPLAVLESWADYDTGIHLFTGGGNDQVIALISKTSVTGTAQTQDGEKPTQTDTMSVTVLLNGAGTVYIRVGVATIGGAQAEAPSEIISQVGSQWIKVASNRGDQPFGAPQVADVFVGGADLTAQLDLKADKADTYTKTQCDDTFVNWTHYSLNAFTGRFPNMNGALFWANEGNSGYAALSLIDVSQPGSNNFRLYYGNPGSEGVLAFTSEIAAAAQVAADATTALTAYTAAQLALKASKADLDYLAANAFTKPEVRFADQFGAIKWGLDTNPNYVYLSLTLDKMEGGLPIFRLQCGSGEDFYGDIAYVQEVEALGEKIANDLTAYAKLDDNTQAIRAKTVRAESHGFYPLSADIALATIGNEIRPVFRVLANTVPFAFTTEIPDTSTFAQREDSTQNLLAKTVTAEAIGFGAAVTPRIALTHTDTGAGYGERLVLATDSDLEYIVYISDIASFASRFDALESKQATIASLEDQVGLLATEVGLCASATKNTAGHMVDLERELASKTLPSDINSPDLAAFRISILEEVKRLLSGGKTVPPDIDWTPCTKVLGAGVIEARLLNGVIYLKGDLAFNPIASVGSFTLMQKLPASFPKPSEPQSCIVHGIDTGVSYRRVTVRFDTSGDISIAADGRVTGVTFNGATAYAY